MAFSTTDEIATFFRNAYADLIRLNAMQLDSVLSGTTDRETLRGEVLFLDKYGQASITEITDRIQATTHIETPRFRRQMPPRYWTITERFDFLTDPLMTMRALRPDSQYMRQVMGKFNQQKDILVLAAMDQDELDGDGMTVTFGAGQTIDHDATLGINSGTGLTVDKIIIAHRIFRENRVPRNVRWYCVIHPDNLDQLLASVESGTSNIDPRLINIDFSGLQPLRNGDPGMFMGFEILVSADVPAETNLDGMGGNGHYAYFYAEPAIVLGMGSEVRIFFDTLPTVRHAFQVAHYVAMNAVRIHEEMVVRAECIVA